MMASSTIPIFTAPLYVSSSQNASSTDSHASVSYFNNIPQYYQLAAIPEEDADESEDEDDDESNDDNRLNLLNGDSVHYSNSELSSFESQEQRERLDMSNDSNKLHSQYFSHVAWLGSPLHPFVSGSNDSSSSSMPGSLEATDCEEDDEDVTNEELDETSANDYDGDDSDDGYGSSDCSDHESDSEDSNWKSPSGKQLQLEDDDDDDDGMAHLDAIAALNSVWRSPTSLLEDPSLLRMSNGNATASSTTAFNYYDGNAESKMAAVDAAAATPTPFFDTSLRMLLSGNQTRTPHGSSVDAHSHETYSQPSIVETDTTSSHPCVSQSQLSPQWCGTIPTLSVIREEDEDEEEDSHDFVATTTTDNDGPLTVRPTRATSFSTPLEGKDDEVSGRLALVVLDAAEGAAVSCSTNGGTTTRSIAGSINNDDCYNIEQKHGNDNRQQQQKQRLAEDGRNCFWCSLFPPKDDALV